MQGFLMSHDIIVGIDLGTTNSAVAIVQDGIPQLLHRDEQKIIPSVVAYSKQAGWLVGRPALNQYILDPDNTIRSIKRKIGSDEIVTLGGHTFTPQQVSAFILRELKNIAEEALGQSVIKAVITVPAYFTNVQRQATKEAGEIAGLEVVRIINEPTAAALAYGLNDEDDQMALVYDLGGGTFDVSLVEMTDGIVEVRASHGDTQLGGDDFDQVIAEYAEERFQQKHNLALTDNRIALARLRHAAEMAKIDLSDYPEAKLQEEYLTEQNNTPLHLDTTIVRSKFEELSESLLNRTIESIERVMTDGELAINELDRVILVGGSTRMPVVWDIVSKHTKVEPDSGINPDEVVALGAAVQAAIIAGQPVGSILVDVTPYSLGIETATMVSGQIVPDIYSVLIRRNTTIPVTKEEIFHTVYSTQDTVAIKVYQGEAPVASANTLLGDFLIENLKQARPGENPSVNVQFDFDVNGMLNVQATDRVTGKSTGISVQATQSTLTPQEIAVAREQLAEFEFFYEEEEDEDEEIIEAPVTETSLIVDEETQALLKRAQELIDDGTLNDDQIKNLTHLTERISKATAQDMLDELSEELLDILFDLE